MSNDELLSKTISFLRFPLIVGVVLIHSNIMELPIADGNLSNQWPHCFYVIVNFFSWVIPSVCVPLYFLISGFLFFYKIDFTAEQYVKKLKSRVKTLLVPYLVWNFIGFLWFTVRHFPLASISSAAANAEYSIAAFVKSF